jgi:hypothetical protein
MTIPSNLATRLNAMPLATLDDVIRQWTTPLERINANPPAGRDNELASANAALALAQQISAQRHAAITSPPPPDTAVVLTSVTAAINQAAQ